MLFGKIRPVDYFSRVPLLIPLFSHEIVIRYRGISKIIPHPFLTSLDTKSINVDIIKFELQLSSQDCLSDIHFIVKYKIVRFGRGCSLIIA
jgi:hypothetical protein